MGPAQNGIAAGQQGRQGQERLVAPPDGGQEQAQRQWHEDDQRAGQDAGVEPFGTQFG